ncbi:uncharacterized protein LOC141900499 isoform X3 [Tubulanus polymorphus]|uniref:uncharacterized protein LOC141900499 isoform X3 n=1 Tax=Tubulanus polymorphus TaxID=672921 RepID=UPI003DA57BB3
MAVLNLELICHYINEQLDQLAVDNECKWIYHRQVEHRMTGLAKGYWTITETFTWPKIMKFVTVLLTAAFVVDSTNGIQSQDYQNMLNYMKANEELFRQFLSLDEPCGPNKEYVKLIPPPNMECLKPPEPPMEWLAENQKQAGLTIGLIIGVSVIAVCIILLIVGYKKHYQKKKVGQGPKTDAENNPPKIGNVGNFCTTPVNRTSSMEQPLSPGDEPATPSPKANGSAFGSNFDWIPPAEVDTTVGYINEGLETSPPVSPLHGPSTFSAFQENQAPDKDSRVDPENGEVRQDTNAQHSKNLSGETECPVLTKNNPDTLGDHPKKRKKIKKKKLKKLKKVFKSLNNNSHGDESSPAPSDLVKQLPNPLPPIYSSIPHNRDSIA